MSELSERQKEILDMVVGEYIRSASPVSSAALKKRYDLDISPATIRLDFADLADQGFLKKGYVSGGRLPTDKGYRYYVDKLSERRDTEEASLEFSDLFREIDDAFRLCHLISKSLADRSSSLAMSYFGDGGNAFWKEGWSKVIEAPEFEDVRYLKRFVKTVNELEENIGEIEIPEKEKISVFIGREIPFGEKDFSIVMGRSEAPKRKSTFVLLGPKRMDFKRNISLVSSIVKSAEKAD